LLAAQHCIGADGAAEIVGERSSLLPLYNFTVRWWCHVVNLAHPSNLAEWDLRQTNTKFFLEEILKFSA
jgi:hypothetical protein